MSLAVVKSGAPAPVVSPNSMPRVPELCPTCGGALPFDRVIVVREEWAVAARGRIVRLHPQEFEIFESLRSARGVVSGRFLLDVCRIPSLNALRVYVSRLRNKIAPLGYDIPVALRHDGIELDGGAYRLRTIARGVCETP